MVSQRGRSTAQRGSIGHPGVGSNYTISLIEFYATTVLWKGIKFWSCLYKFHLNRRVISKVALIKW